MGAPRRPPARSMAAGVPRREFQRSTTQQTLATAPSSAPAGRPVFRSPHDECTTCLAAAGLALRRAQYSQASMHSASTSHQIPLAYLSTLGDPLVRLHRHDTGTRRARGLGRAGGEGRHPQGRATQHGRRHGDGFPTSVQTVVKCRQYGHERLVERAAVPHS
eukprot:119853-Chlamydomonas_euryale.AAC.5